MANIDLKVIESLKLGAGKAEVEVELLRDSFSPRPELKRLSGINALNPSEVDIVAGPKGAGKSAIAWALHDQAYSFGDERLIIVDLLDTFDTSGPALRDTFEKAAETKLSSGQLVNFWNALIDIAIASELLANGEVLRRSSARSLVAVLEGYGIAPPGELTRSQRFLQAIRTAANLSDLYQEPSYQTILEVSAEQNKRTTGLEQALEESDILVWVVIDRLDEVFTASHFRWEDRCLSGLIRMMQSRSSLQVATGARVRLKLLVRSDFLMRASRADRITNAEVLRTTQIKWSREQFAEMIYRWLSLSPDFRDRFSIGSNERYLQFMRRIFPLVKTDQSMPTSLIKKNGGSEISCWDWLCVYCRNSETLYNPRYVLWALSHARDLALAEGRSSVPGAGLGGRRKTLFGVEHIAQGWLLAGEDAMQRIGAESPEIADLFRFGLPERKTRFSIGEFDEWLEKRTDVPKRLSTMLLDLGIMQTADNETVMVAPLYQGVLRVPPDLVES